MRMKKALIAVALLAFAAPSFADWFTVTVTNIEFVADNTFSSIPGLDNGQLVIFGTFSPALPCSVKAFSLYSTDPLYKETYSMLMAAQLSGTPIRYFHVYCNSASGVGRGNLYLLGN